MSPDRIFRNKTPGFQPPEEKKSAWRYVRIVLFVLFVIAGVGGIAWMIITNPPPKKLVCDPTRPHSLNSFGTCEEE